MSSWSNLLHHAQTDHHVVHLYGRNDASLVSGIAEYAAEGLLRQEPVLIVATQAHAEAVRRELDEEDVDVASAIEQGSLRFVDAELLLQELVGDGEPRWEVFRDMLEPSALENLIGPHSHTCAGTGTLFTMLRDRPRDVRAAVL